MQINTETTHIQDQIIVNLLTANEELRFSEIRPHDVENDLFNYHLKQLLQKGLINKVNNKYTLSDKGKIYVETIKPLRRWVDTASRFKLYSLGIVFKKDSKNKIIWNRKRNRHPFFGDMGISGASVKAGETSAEALITRLKDQTGLIVKKDDMRQILNIRKINYLKNGTLFSDMIYVIYFVNDYEGTLVDQSKYGSNHWVSLPEAISNEQSSKTHLNALIDLLKKIETVDSTQITPTYSEEVEVIAEY